MKRYVLHAVLAGIVSLALTACAAAASTTAEPPVTPATPVATVAASTPEPEQSEAPPQQTRVDEQGAVSVVVTPLNLDAPGETLDFEVAMNTHSVDLSMDLGTLATLTTDTGLSVTPTAWTGAAGGHHVSGTLSFPAAADGVSLLEGASTLTLVIRDVDAPERTFAWELGG